MKNWLKKNMVVAVVALLLVAYLLLNITGVLSCNKNEEAVSGDRQEETVYTQISIDEININYSFKNRRVQYKYFLSNNLLSERYKGRLLLDSFRDGNTMRPSLVIYIDRQDAVASFLVRDDFYPCLSAEAEENGLNRVEENNKLCGDMQKLLRDWTAKLEVNERVENALKTPVVDTGAYRP